MPTDNTKTGPEFSDEYTSFEFKKRWGSDALAKYKEESRSTRYHYQISRQFLADMKNERAHFQRTGGKPLEPGDFVLPEKSWQPDQH